MRESSFHPHSSHWGAFAACWDGQSLSVKPHPGDPCPNALLGNFASALRHSARVTGPAVRRGWLERGPGPDHRRGREEFVKLPWDEVLDRLAADLMRVKRTHGPAGIYGGSYGWASAGRFHHAQSQLHRFLNTTLGGYVRSENSYSAGASSVILPHVLGPWEKIARNNVTWAQITAHTDVVLAFGGMALRNMQVASGGINPLRYQLLVDNIRAWFSEHPLYDAEGQPIEVPEWVFPTRGKVQKQLKRAKAMSNIACGYDSRPLDTPLTPCPTVSTSPSSKRSTTWVDRAWCWPAPARARRG